MMDWRDVAFVTPIAIIWFGCWYWMLFHYYLPLARAIQTRLVELYAEAEDHGVLAYKRGEPVRDCPWDASEGLGKHWVIGWRKQRDLMAALEETGQAWVDYSFRKNGKSMAKAEMITSEPIPVLGGRLMDLRTGEDVTEIYALQNRQKNEGTSND
jgi:hypothetical protein